MAQKKEQLSQHRLALELRAAIDIARLRPQPVYADSVKRLIDDNPHGTRSRHVEHNLGEARLNWLYELGMLPRGGQ